MKFTYAGVSRTDSMGNLSIIFQNMRWSAQHAD